MIYVNNLTLKNAFLLLSTVKQEKFKFAIKFSNNLNEIVTLFKDLIVLYLIYS